MCVLYVAAMTVAPGRSTFPPFLNVVSIHINHSCFPRGSACAFLNAAGSTSGIAWKINGSRVILDRIDLLFLVEGNSNAGR
jgi:hypothetical protein